ncbi:ABC transporter ATP-binding protein [Virgisporangium aurantiacum]|uniref:Daunorubicin resistance protein DrrA family ABC transporter ATP-binding protein n=1 Tax=Virgisporangium aurantiacum TaxID=175570 RepID=A0A8J3ZIW9_9ACTN|nr:ABC transporter ATP-binding protein [Virgisporangium aurantiacum]GIJ64636.1 daunorubicin resistance protein DrrA family ABC transporter ATP-binding protein [Virgisporangium aurantiacum]
MTPAVTVVDAVKRYRDSDHNAVDGITFDIQTGQVVGILGPNGAGKSTLIKLICGVMPPTSGAVAIFGADPADYRIRRDLGAVHQTTSFDMMLPVLDNLRIAAAFRGLRWQSVRSHVDSLLAAFNLVSCVDQLVFTLSGGQQRRLQVVRALLRVPRLLLLDEPSAGMDVAGRRLVWQLLDEITAGYGTTVLWTSHNIDELERKCEQVLVINRGRLVEYASPTELVDRFGQSHLAIRPALADHGPRIVEFAACAGLHGEAGTGVVRLSGPDVADRLPGLLATLWEHGVGVVSVEVRRTSLEDVFMKLTAEEADREEVGSVA